MYVSILSKCSERLSFKGVKSSVCERTCLIYLCVVTLRIIKFSGECCTTLAGFFLFKKRPAMENVARTFDVYKKDLTVLCLN